jgi:hypothetical protein
MADNVAAELALQAQIDRIRALAELPKVVAPEVATELRGQLERQIAAGQGPDGEPWQLTAEGRVPLRNAAAALTVRAVGSAVVARLVGPTALHHLGAAAGRIRRRILPTRQLPHRMTEAIREVVARRFRELTGGR